MHPSETTVLEDFVEFDFSDAAAGPVALDVTEERGARSSGNLKVTSSPFVKHPKATVDGPAEHLDRVKVRFADQKLEIELPELPKDVSLFNTAQGTPEREQKRGIFSKLRDLLVPPTETSATISVDGTTVSYRGTGGDIIIDGTSVSISGEQATPWEINVELPEWSSASIDLSRVSADLKGNFTKAAATTANSIAHRDGVMQTGRFTSKSSSVEVDQVPQGGTLDAQGRNGVKINRLNGSGELLSEMGKIRINKGAASGQTTLVARDGVHAPHFAATVDARSSMGEVLIGTARGESQLEGRDAARAKAVDGSVTMRSAMGEVAVGEVPNGSSVTANGRGDVTVGTLLGHGRFTSKIGEVTVTHANPDGPVHLRARDGVKCGVASEFARQKINAHSSFGDNDIYIADARPRNATAGREGPEYGRGNSLR